MEKGDESKSLKCEGANPGKTLVDFNVPEADEDFNQMVKEGMVQFGMRHSEAEANIIARKTAYKACKESDRDRKKKRC